MSNPQVDTILSTRVSICTSVCKYLYVLLSSELLWLADEGLDREQETTAGQGECRRLLRSGESVRVRVKDCGQRVVVRSCGHRVTVRKY